jgi:hypothetical protein
MSIIAPPVRKHLSADALFRLIHNDFARLPDYRVGDTEIALADALMSAFAMFSLKLTFRTLFSGSIMVFEECSLAKRGLVL